MRKITTKCARLSWDEVEARKDFTSLTMDMEWVEYPFYLYWRSDRFEFIDIFSLHEWQLPESTL